MSLCNLPFLVYIRDRPFYLSRENYLLNRSESDKKVPQKIRSLCEMCSPESGHFYQLLARKLIWRLLVFDHVLDGIMYSL